MSPNEKIAQLEELERRDQGRRRTVARVSWLSVAAAAAVLAVMILASYRELSAIRTEIVSLTAQKTKLTTENQQLENENKLKSQTIRDLDPPYDPTRQFSHEAVLPVIRVLPPSPVTIPARIYLQTVSEDDRDFARQVSQDLTNARYVVAGIENVPNAAKPSQTEVRFYKKDDEQGANDIAKILLKAGAGPVRPLYLSRYENSTAARPKHYEIWFPAGISKARHVN